MSKNEEMLWKMFLDDVSELQDYPWTPCKLTPVDEALLEEMNQIAKRRMTDTAYLMDKVVGAEE